MNYDKVLESLSGQIVTIEDSDGRFAGMLRLWTSPAGKDGWLVAGPDGIDGVGPWVLFAADSVNNIAIGPHHTIIRLISRVD